jgi:hypothetical protein
VRCDGEDGIADADDVVGAGDDDIAAVLHRGDDDLASDPDLARSGASVMGDPAAMRTR